MQIHGSKIVTTCMFLSIRLNTCFESVVWFRNKKNLIVNYVLLSKGLEYACFVTGGDVWYTGKAHGTITETGVIISPARISAYHHHVCVSKDCST